MSKKIKSLYSIMKQVMTALPEDSVKSFHPRYLTAFHTGDGIGPIKSLQLMEWYLKSLNYDSIVIWADGFKDKYTIFVQIISPFTGKLVTASSHSYVYAMVAALYGVFINTQDGTFEEFQDVKFIN